MRTVNDDADLLQREAHDWIARFISGEATPADLEALKAWYKQSPAHAAAYKQARRLWRALGPAAGNSRTENGERHAPKVAPALVGRRAFLGGAVGAAAAAGAYVAVRPPFDLWPSFAQLKADYRTATGEQRQIKVADGISVDLNTRTSMTLEPGRSGNERLRLISGEAMVSVADPQRAFSVVAADGRIIASHAKFNVRYDRGGPCTVSCLDGSLTVEMSGGTILLTANQQVSYDERGLQPVTATDREMVTAWQKDLLIFKLTPVAQAIEQVNRYRPGRIVLLNEDIGHRVLNARFRIDEADKIVGQIVRIFGAHATYLPGGLVILT
ncbi:FecR domain-containing protein [Microbacteriaceae bacterium K1510]|nr:FecR domain-containing protein [Microbacteriaceae bacterium K1510]